MDEIIKPGEVFSLFTDKDYELVEFHLLIDESHLMTECRKQVAGSVESVIHGWRKLDHTLSFLYRWAQSFSVVASFLAHSGDSFQPSSPSSQLLRANCCFKFGCNPSFDHCMQLYIFHTLAASIELSLYSSTNVITDPITGFKLSTLKTTFIKSKT